MLADWIIGTSFAPSPIESVRFFSLCFASRTISALFFGVIRQHTPEEQCENKSKKYKLSKISGRADPYTKSPYDPPSSNIYRLSQYPRNSSSSMFFSVTFITFSCSLKSWQLLAMFSAVYSLSPVNMHTFIFARIMSAITDGTSS